MVALLRGSAQSILLHAQRPLRNGGLPCSTQSNPAVQASHLLDSYKGRAYPGRVTFRLRFSDMDTMLHVNNVSYFTFFEQARCELWVATGMSLNGKGEGPILKTIGAEFKAPLQFPDEVTVGVRAVQLSPKEYEHSYACISHASGRVVATGHALFVNFDYDQGRPVDMSETMRKMLFA